jgi:hypothetical protein
MHEQSEAQADDDDAQFLVDNLDQVEDYLAVSCNLAGISLAIDIDTVAADFIAFQSNESTLLLDSCSTLNLFADKSLLHDIHQVDKYMHVRCNAGVTSMNLMGWFRDFPELVWFNPDGVANILLLYIMTQHYTVKMNSKQDNAFYVTKPDGSVLRFAPMEKGLYACSSPAASESSGWALINTVEERKQEYTKREYRNAVLARKVQNIIMFPGVREYTKIADSKLIANCPIGRVDIMVAERIFGTNLGALKGKTVYHSGVPVSGRIEGVLPTILERYQKVILSIDIIFVNKIPMLLTVLHGLSFRTVENLANRKVPTVAAALERVLKVYGRRGFRIVTINADPEFDPLAAIFGDISFNFCSQDEHVPDIERYVRTVKD